MHAGIAYIHATMSTQADSIQTAILRNHNQEVSRLAMYRALFDHTDWRGGGAGGFLWIASTEEGAAKIGDSVRADLIGETAAIPHLDDYIAKLPANLPILKVDPAGPISLVMGESDMPYLLPFAHGVRAERAMRERDYARVRAYDFYFVPYYGELGKGHQIIQLPTERGSMVAAFTAWDAIERFLATGSDDNRAKVKFVTIAGEDLFATNPSVAQGVIVNVAGPKTYGFDLAACADVLAA
jgi:hypothetical protein